MKPETPKGLHKKVVLAVLATLLLLGIAGLDIGPGHLGLTRGLQDLLALGHATLAVPHVTPAGIAAAELSAGGIELSGWAPAGTEIRILDHDKPVALTVTGAGGRWRAAYATSRNHRDIGTLTIVYEEKGKAPLPMGRLMLWLPEPSSDSAYLWWQDGDADALRLLQAPESADDNDLALALAARREGGTPLFAGRAAPGSIVQVYADGVLVGTATADAGGFWGISALPGADKKDARLRFDEIHDRSHVVAERRSYHLAWPDATETAGNEPAVLRNEGDDWVASVPFEGGAGLLYILKPEAGEALSPDDEIPGEIMPLALPADSRSAG